MGRLTLVSVPFLFRTFATHVSYSFADPQRAARRLLGYHKMPLSVGCLSMVVRRACRAHN